MSSKKSKVKIVTFLVFALFGFLLLFIFDFFGNIDSAQAISGSWPSTPSYVGDNSETSGTHLTEGAIKWEKVAPGSTPGTYDHITGATFLLVATQANWDGSQAVQGSMMTVMDCTSSPCGGPDLDPRPGYYSITRTNGMAAQEFVYRVWEIAAPSGYDGQYIINSYDYTTPLSSGVKRTGNLIYYPNSSWQSGQPVDGWDLGQFINYSNTPPISLTWTKTNADQSSLLGGAVFRLFSPSNSQWNNIDITDCISSPCDSNGDQDPVAGQFQISGITQSDLGNWTLAEVTAPSGYQISNVNYSAYVDNYNRNASFGNIANSQIVDPTYSYIAFEKVDSTNSTIHLPNSIWSLTISFIPSGATTREITDCSADSATLCPNYNQDFYDIDPRVGYFQVKIDNPVPSLPISTFLLSEKDAPPGYTKNPSSKTFYPSVFNSSLTYDLGSIQNTKNKLFLTWEKTDQDSNHLGGSEWSFTSDGYAGITSTKVIDYTGQSTYQCKDTAPADTTVICDLDPRVGYFRIFDDDYTPDSGNYTFTLTETTAPVGYNLLADSITTPELSLTYPADNLYEFGVLQNTPELNNLNWSVADSMQVSPLIYLANSIWTITQTDGSNNYTNITDWDGSNNYTGLDQDPRVGYFQITSIPKGTYQLFETQAPNGYYAVGNEAEISLVTVNAGDSATFTDPVYDTDQILNMPIATRVQWTKQDSDGATITASSSDHSATFLICPVTAAKPLGDCDSTSPPPVHIADCMNPTGCSSGPERYDLDPNPGQYMRWSLYSGSWAYYEIKAPSGYYIDDPTETQFLTILEYGPGKYYNLNNIVPDLLKNNRLAALTWSKVSDLTSLQDGSPILIGPSEWSLSVDGEGTIHNIVDCVGPDENDINYCLNQSTPSYTIGEDYFDLDPRIGLFKVYVPYSTSVAGKQVKLTEITAPSGYQKDSTDYLSSNLAANLVYDYGAITNSIIPPAIQWWKTDPGNNPIGGATFYIDYSSAGYTDVVVTDWCDDPAYTGNDADPRCGFFAYSNLNIGTITLSEFTPANNDLANDKVYILTDRQETWTSSAGTNFNFATAFSNLDYPILEFALVGADKVGFSRANQFMNICPSDFSNCIASTKLSGAEFKLVQTLTSPGSVDTYTYSFVDSTISTTYYPNRGNIVDLDPRAGYVKLILIPNLPSYYESENPTFSLGTWTLIETKAPIGYNLDLAPSWTVNSNSAIELNHTYFMTSNQTSATNSNDIPFIEPVVVRAIQNQPIEGSIKFQKVDQNNQTLSNAEFTLINTDDGFYEDYTITDCVATCYLDARDTDGGKILVDTDSRAGYYQIDNIHYGNWKLTETKAPQGYSLSNSSTDSGTITNFNITTQDQILDLGTIVNTKITPSPSPTKSPTTSPTKSPTKSPTPTKSPSPTSSPTPPSPIPPNPTNPPTCPEDYVLVDDLCYYYTDPYLPATGDDSWDIFSLVGTFSILGIISLGVYFLQKRNKNQ